MSASSDHPAFYGGEGCDFAAWCASYAKTVPTARLVRLFWAAATANPRRRKTPRDTHERRLAMSDAAVVTEIARRRETP